MLPVVSARSWNHRYQGRRRRSHLVGQATDWGYRDAVVCSGGGNLGAAQVGMLQVLLAEGIQPDVAVGCSVGALNATYLAVNPNLERLRYLETVWRSLDTNDVFTGSRRSVASHLLRRDAYLFEPDGLRALIARCIPVSDLSQTAIPVHVVTTDLERGLPAWWSSGSPGDILAASACLPGIFPPVTLDAGPHVDGGVLCPVPVDKAVELGAERIWVLDVTGDRTPALPAHPSALDVLLTSFAVARKALLPDTAELVTSGRQIISISLPEIPNLDVRDFSRTGELVEAGRQAAQRALAALPAATPIRLARQLQPAG
jgi:NTE family protein